MRTIEEIRNSLENYKCVTREEAEAIMQHCKERLSSFVLDTRFTNIEADVDDLEEEIRDLRDIYRRAKDCLKFKEPCGEGMKSVTVRLTGITDGLNWRTSRVRMTVPQSWIDAYEFLSCMCYEANSTGRGGKTEVYVEEGIEEGVPYYDADEHGFRMDGRKPETRREVWAWAECMPAEKQTEEEENL